MDLKDKKQLGTEWVREHNEALPDNHVEAPWQQRRLLEDPRWARKMEDPEFAWRQKYKYDRTLNGRPADNGGSSWLSPPSLMSIWTKLFISAVIFALIWGMFHIQQPWADRGRQLVVAALTQSMDFNAVSTWYEKYLDGSPSFIPSFRDRGDNASIKVSTENRTYFIPAQGKISSLFDAEHAGLRLQTRPEDPVYALDTGQVIFSGIKEDTGLTVIIRHPGGIQSLYGGLGEKRVEVNDWIKGGEPIGKVLPGEDSTGSLWFAVSKDGHFINPTDVISFD
ncbi:M23 family metallopeptidase [Paenibacillus eucommiae]|uniref:Stage IV sporulation protein FA n=1 Tax=Paenibacillus eucommiae TaxID=1355755 RepID=A0ABS4JAB2_9BACL|nr:M23 family metallopeptidase [Paenibacillus eucommiae]MBP1996793.1 stage IV sporulation protein FA [Paenibacillus eucommiae]